MRQQVPCCSCVRATRCETGKVRRSCLPLTPPPIHANNNNNNNCVCVCVYGCDWGRGHLSAKFVASPKTQLHFVIKTSTALRVTFIGDKAATRRRPPRARVLDVSFDRVGNTHVPNNNTIIIILANLHFIFSPLCLYNRTTININVIHHNNIIIVIVIFPVFSFLPFDFRPSSSRATLTTWSLLTLAICRLLLPLLLLLLLLLQ